MIRLSKLADYAVVMLSHMAAREGEVYTTARLAERSAVPEPTAAKISPEMEKKTQDMLKNYSKQYNEMYRAKKQSPRG